MWQQMRHELLPELSGYSLAEDNKRPREYSSEREKWILLALIFFFHETLACSASVFLVSEG